jgi:hypothetical protein
VTHRGLLPSVRHADVTALPAPEELRHHSYIGTFAFLVGMCAMQIPEVGARFTRNGNLCPGSS